MKALHINGNDLTLEAVREVAVERRPVLLAPDARDGGGQGARGGRRDRCQQQDFVRDHDRRGQTERCADCRSTQIRELQVNLVRSHAVGVGDPLPVAETRAMMLLRANSLSKGYSGVRAACDRHDLRDAQPRRDADGAVARERRRKRRPGATGALALALIGEGECLTDSWSADSNF